MGFGRAVELAQQEMGEEAEQLTYLRNKLIKGLEKRIDHIRLNGHPLKRLPNNVNVSVDFVERESILLNLDVEAFVLPPARLAAHQALSHLMCCWLWGSPLNKRHYIVIR